MRANIFFFLSTTPKSPPCLQESPLSLLKTIYATQGMHPDSVEKSLTVDFYLANDPKNT
jgi:hypothetical protein